VALVGTNRNAGVILRLVRSTSAGVQDNFRQQGNRLNAGEENRIERES
jgi:hypothetical protein